MKNKRSLTSDEISKIVRSFDSIDVVQMKLLAKLPPGKRMYPSLQASAMLRAGLRTAFKKKFPNLLLPEINMKVLEYLTFMDTKT